MADYSYKESDHVFFEAVAEFEDELRALDIAASRFRTDSEINYLCQNSNGQPIKVSPLLFEAISAAIEGAQVTNGSLDPTIGASLVALGYEKDFEEITKASRYEYVKVQPVLPFGYQRVVLHAGQRAVRVPMGTKLDLGATAKAFCADRILQNIRAKLDLDILVNLGGDLAASTRRGGDPWSISLPKDGSLEPTSPGPVVGMVSGGLATSSTTKRTWLKGDETYHHILDPRSGESANSPFTAVTVHAASALDANIASAGTIAKGVEGLKWLAELGLPAFALDLDGNSHYFGGWNSQIMDFSRC